MNGTFLDKMMISKERVGINSGLETILQNAAIAYDRLKQAQIYHLQSNIDVAFKHEKRRVEIMKEKTLLSFPLSQNRYDVHIGDQSPRGVFQ